MPRVLIIVPGALGDLICFLPALRVLARRYPGHLLELMARGELAQLAVGRTPVRVAHSLERREVSLLFSAEPRAGALAAEFFRPFAAIHSLFASGDPGFGAALRQACGGTVYSYPFRPEPAQGHIARAYLEALGGEVPDELEAHLDPTAADLHQARALLAERGLQPGRFVLLMPGSGSPRKNWPAGSFRALGEHLSRRLGLLVALGPAEAGWQAAFRGLPTIATPSLGELAGMARLARAFVGNDSGVSHLAAAAGARGVVIFGPTEPARWRPLGRVTILARPRLDDLTWPEVASAMEPLVEGE